jgi:hypothetical protein
MTSPDAYRRDTRQTQLRRADAPQELPIDGRFLRTGAANFSASGLKRQDNDLIVIESAWRSISVKHAFSQSEANYMLC